MRINEQLSAKHETNHRSWLILYHSCTFTAFCPIIYILLMENEHRRGFQSVLLSGINLVIEKFTVCECKNSAPVVCYLQWLHKQKAFRTDFLKNSEYKVSGVCTALFYVSASNPTFILDGWIFNLLPPSKKNQRWNHVTWLKMHLLYGYLVLILHKARTLAERENVTVLLFHHKYTLKICAISNDDCMVRKTECKIW